MLDWFTLSQALGAVFALVSIAYSVRIMTLLKRGATVWIYFGVTSSCMFIAMLLGTVSIVHTVDSSIQRLEQYMFLLVGAIAFAISGVKLYDLLAYKFGGE